MVAEHLVICASPRAMGASAVLAKNLVSAIKERFPEDRVALLKLSDLHIAPCTGCNTCRAEGRCCFEDDMDRVMDALVKAQHLYVVSPVYFAGPPAQYKAMLDRLQPHYWQGTRRMPKRLATLIVVGDGGDPNGFEPLVVCTRSALAVAGFQLARVQSYVGTARDVAAKQLPGDLFESEG